MNRFGRLAVYPDPVIEKFNDIRLYRPDDYLTINGRYLDAAATERDVIVVVGGQTCNLTALANRALTCQPPSSRTQIDVPENIDPDVVVKIGGMRFIFLNLNS